MKIAVFTGASSGMGREFVRRITAEQKFDEVWVIAEEKSVLRSLKMRLTCR